MRILISILLPVLLAPGTAAQEEEQPARQPGLYATLETSMGVIVITFFEDEAPITVRNFIGLATGEKAWTHPGTGETMDDTPFYDGIIFHRVIPNFMIQAGDPLGTGEHGPGYTIRNEVHPSLKYDRPGRVGMANAGPDTGGSQFFITHGPTPHLNDRYTIFGQVIKGQEIVNAIGNVPRDFEDRPRISVTIKHVKIERVNSSTTQSREP